MLTEGMRVYLVNFPACHGTIAKMAGEDGQATIQFDGGVSATFNESQGFVAPLPFPRGSFVLDPMGNRRRVIEEVGDLRFVSSPVPAEEDTMNGSTLQQIMSHVYMLQSGYVPYPAQPNIAQVPPMPPAQNPSPVAGSRVTPENVSSFVSSNSLPKTEEQPIVWPDIGSRYFYVTTAATVGWARWTGDEADQTRRSAFGIYKTPEEVEEVLAKLKQAIKKP